MITAPVPTDRVILDVRPGPKLDALQTRGERLAFWINAYNALVGDGITALGIRESVWEAPDFFARISYRFGGLVFSADEIEHGVLRGNRPNPLSGVAPFPADDPRLAHAVTPLDPRVHFAISCGARSCPRVRGYHGLGLDAQLDEAARAFVNREVTLDGQILTASPIFKWFRADFDDFPGGLAGFLAQYLDEGPVRRALFGQGVARLAWRPYDWRLPLPMPAGGAGAE
ncbi:MAG: DUF547 domain-containing protein [Candidatus Rokubacteria bacterium]|nr:DUF547 domain-containing protein [Candidatus Rokubacteria bacterium]